jgi:hypothetical protein
MNSNSDIARRVVTSRPGVFSFNAARTTLAREPAGAAQRGYSMPCGKGGPVGAA